MIDDGVVKYSLCYEPSAPIAIKQCEEIERVREELYALGLIGAYSNGIGYGNISLKYNEKNAFVITATQTGHLKTLSPNEYSLVQTIDFKTFSTQATGPSKPSSEAISHGCIYTLDKNINAVIHIHNEKLWKYMLENDYLSTNDTPYGTLEMVEDIKEIYENIDVLSHNAFVMKGHFEGIVTFGKNLDDAQKALFQIIKKVL